jgi:hypothetical protein
MVTTARSLTDWSGNCASSLRTNSCAALTLSWRSTDSAAERKPRTIRRNALMARKTSGWALRFCFGIRGSDQEKSWIRASDPPINVRSKAKALPATVRAMRIAGQEKLFAQCPSAMAARGLTTGGRTLVFTEYKRVCYLFV